MLRHALVFDHFSDGFRAQAGAQVDHALENGGVTFSAAGAFDVGTIDLDDIGREVAQIVEARCTGAEVVETDSMSALADLGDDIVGLGANDLLF